MNDRLERIRGTGRSWLLWIAVLVLAHLVLLETRDTDARQAHVALTFMLVIVGGSASGARGLGLTLAGLGVALLDYSYQRPFGTWSVDKLTDGVVLAAFVATAIATTSLVARSRNEAERADARAREVRELSAAADRAHALEETDRLKDALLASVSHDLRTPLTTIRALASDDAGQPEIARAEIRSQVDRLDTMVRNVLDLSRISAGLTPHIELNAAEDLVGAAIRQSAARVRNHPVRSTLAGAEVPLGRFDFEQSLRALTNLLDNAARYSPEGTPIDIRVQRDGDVLSIAVADRGPGIPPDEAEQVFTRFYRRPGAPSDGGNAGLGLAIARGIAQAQGGSVEFAPRPGGGSVFTLTVPAADPPGGSRESS